MASIGLGSFQGPTPAPAAAWPLPDHHQRLSSSAAQSGTYLRFSFAEKKEQQGHFTRCGFDIILSFGKWDYLESSQLKYWNMYWDILGHDSFWWQTINWTSLKQLRSHCIQEAIFPNLCASQCHMDHIGLWRNMSLMNLILKYFWTSGTIFMYKKDYCGTWFMILKHQVP